MFPFFSPKMNDPSVYQQIAKQTDEWKKKLYLKLMTLKTH